MPGQSLTTVIGGPCLITYRGSTFRSKGDVLTGLALETFAIETSLYGQVDERVREGPIKISFTPDGEWTALSVLWPYANTPIGTFITPQVPIFSVAASQANVGSTAALLSGDAMVFGVQGVGSVPGGLVAGTLYYVHVISGTNISIHTTYANAVAGTNPIAITSGTGNTVGVVNNPLTVQTLDGFLWTFLNVAVVKMPNLTLSTVKTAIGEVQFEAFLADGVDWNATNARYTYAANPWPGDTGFSPAAILTGEIAATWRNMSAPWASFDTKDGWEVEFNMSLEAQPVDNTGIITRRLSNLVVRAKSIPLGVQPSDLTANLYLQGTNAARGRSLATFGNDLLLSAAANNLGCKLFNAALEGGPVVYSNKTERIGRLSWVATRTFGSSGINPLFSIGNQNVT